ncbi:MAG: 2-amino-4-hydroxy-6-hydroxymethyldihydropteridine diphosphokinase, partial [Planctomycetota bacterium]
MRAFIALGSNLGDSLGILTAAIASLSNLPATELLAQSRLHRTSPIGGPVDQPDYLNGVALLETELAPLPLLNELQRIEAQAGRDRTQEERWG